MKKNWDMKKVKRRNPKIMSEAPYMYFKLYPNIYIFAHSTSSVQEHFKRVKRVFFRVSNLGSCYSILS